MSRAFDLPVPSSLQEQDGRAFGKLVEVMQRLLAPDGCPWDREQDFRSLRRYVLEEACEVMDAIDGEDPSELEEELGDLALQIAFLSELARREGLFGPDDVMRGICEKLVRRHPHVFADVVVDGSDEVVKNWEAIKAQEKRDRPLLGGIPRALPALMRAQRLSEKVAEVGFDWPDSAASRRKVAEEITELDEALISGDKAHVEEELGDVLFTLVNLARHHGIDAEEALRATTDKFTRRFGFVEQKVREVHGDWPRDEAGKPTRGRSLEELDGYWELAKREPSS
jgi:tetrapyrrole methylase family protein/MazG family protein/ATP diphosphatase